MQNRPVLRRFDGGASETAALSGARERDDEGGRRNRGYERRKDRYRIRESCVRAREGVVGASEEGGRAVAAEVYEEVERRAGETRREKRKARARAEYR